MAHIWVIYDFNVKEGTCYGMDFRQQDLTYIRDSGVSLYHINYSKMSANSVSLTDLVVIEVL